MKSKTMNSSNSAMLIIIAAALWGAIGIFFKSLTNVGFNPIQIVFLRVTTAALALTGYLFIKDRSLLKIKLKDAWCFVGTGIFSLVFFNWCYFTAMEMTSLAVAAVLLYTSPIFVMLMSIVLFHEKLNNKKIIALILTFVGCMFVAGVFNGGNGNFSALGIIIGIGSGIGYALYSIFGRYALQKGYDSMTISAYTFIFATISAFPLSRIWDAAPLLANSATIWGSLGIGVLCTVFPFVLYTKGLMGIDTGKAAIFATSEPAVASIISFVVYKETIGFTKLLGILMIFGSVLLLSVPQRKKIQ